MTNIDPALIEIRRLWQSDNDEYCQHLLRLDLSSRRFRFVGGMSDDAVQNYAEKCFGVGDVIFGAFVDGSLIGVAELRSTKPIWAKRGPSNQHIHAEVAFSVELKYQHHGIGEKLFSRILQAASNHGVETIDLMLLSDNTGMRNLAKKFKTRLNYEDGILIGHINTLNPTLYSLFRESVADIFDFSLSAFDAYWRNFKINLIK